MMNRDPKEEGLNWGLDWSDYLTSQRDFIVARVEEHLDPDQVAFKEQEELGKATVARAHAVLRFHSIQMKISKLTMHSHLSGLSYVDSRKLGVVGNGVGGYLASR